eukprot:CAMPEP_0206319352 /NCGR_PEP_ID=MMETSP0106_2-20121207/17710_1 /ASSEMBLY_ACC=CAM_ASM_000206 /TAXON_ID=81532 /ORGANISM="Acanthoeca-like sp., Strain 10tr" /LENGTH=59 /DNA_ID=CAMNT_0053751179 /DNA_START=17 /DNA_END=192 /DNA_ORIENTATION=+
MRIKVPVGDVCADDGGEGGPHTPPGSPERPTPARSEAPITSPPESGRSTSPAQLLRGRG